VRDVCEEAAIANGHNSATADEDCVVATAGKDQTAEIATAAGARVVKEPILDMDAPFARTALSFA